MIDMTYDLHVGDIHVTELSDEYNKLCIPSEDSLTDGQINVFQKILDCVSGTGDSEMRAAYKVGFKDSVALMMEIK
ncbi:MAG: hypothetical protein IJ806_03560 [Ruminococcus sp.]|nr:hypothetical protein [Ruminococcus sp.]